jgi:hypothetical protein
VKKPALVLLMGLVSTAGSRAAEGPGSVQFEVQLLKAMPNEKPLTLYCAWIQTFTGGFAQALAYNKALHDVDLSGLAYDVHAQTIAGTVQVTVNPDDYVPADKIPAACRCRLDLKVRDGVVSGAYAGTYGAAARQGAVEGRLLPASSNDGIYRLLFLHGMPRLSQLGGMNKGYALDMRLRFQVENGRAARPVYENVVPDYRSYSAVIQSLEVSFQDAAFQARLATVLDYGREVMPPGGSGAVRRETNTFMLTGLRIGDKVAGRYTATAGAVTVKDSFFGDVDREPAPGPAGARAFLRLHRAMRREGPVLLNLCLDNAGGVHGFAWAPGYNHQQHAVDASKLKLVGNRLAGDVAVTIWPDCYKPIEDVVLRHAIDVTFEQGVAAGRFKGADNNDPHEGLVTGELARMKPPVVTTRTLGACKLNLHSGAAGGHAAMALAFANGSVGAFHVKYPQWTDPYEARLGRCDLQVEGSRLSGTVVARVKDKTGKESEFAYAMDAMIDGDDVSGFWHGSTGGKPILNKSSKLYGKVVPAAPAQDEDARPPSAR